jgi:hypothetical protein
MLYSRETIEKTVKSMGFKWYEDSSYHLNIVGVRNGLTGARVTNVFDDLITVSYMAGGAWYYSEYIATTEPGKKGVLQYHNPGGVAILAEQQCLDAYVIRKHQGKYDALCQEKPVKFFRDPDKDLLYDMDKLTEGVIGINVHHASAMHTSSLVENWSEGCQVIASPFDFEEFMKLCYEARTLHGNLFTYTLINSNNITS